MKNQYDVVIVGGGTSGCVLAARLSENPDRSVLLLEAGASDEHYPASVREANQAAGNVLGRGNHKVRWFARMRDNTMPTILLRGNMLGGTSAINYMAAVRGMPEDFDGWAAAGCDGWRWQDVLPYFRKAETDHDFGDSPLHGTDGPMQLHRWKPENFLGVHRAFHDGLREMGINEAPDINNRAHLPGVGPFPGTTSADGKTRLSVSQAYLSPAVRQRKNLVIRTQARVQRVLIDAGVATGVELATGEKISAAEVILSCGAFESPKLLMLSGIGPEPELRRHGLPVHLALPGVGQRLQDHVAFGMIYRAPYRQPHQGSPAQCIWIGASKDENDLDFHVLASPVLNAPVVGEWCNVMLFNLHPTTTGTVRLRSTRIEDAPELDLNFLTADRDLQSVITPLESIARWEASDAFQAWGGKRIYPRKIPRTVEELRKAKRWLTISYFHQVGSCAMGADHDPLAVLDTHCRVRGITGLRVVDASSMPRIVRGNTYLCCVMMGEKIAADYA